MSEGPRAAKNKELKEQEEDGPGAGGGGCAGGLGVGTGSPCHRPALSPGPREDSMKAGQ